MIWQEADAIPKECRHCKKDCYNCDVAGKRWVLSQEDELRIKQKMLARAFERLQRKTQGNGKTQINTEKTMPDL